MIAFDGERLASAAGAEVAREGGPGGPKRSVIDSREVRDGDLFLGLAGRHDDGGRFARDALRSGAWGVVVAPRWAEDLGDVDGWVFVAEDPLASLQSLARAWREQLGARVVGITGSTGKTSVKDICR
ncbi:MAG: hypothetical protein ACJ75Z_01790, partial [Solirubrobacterales bacterium]